MSKVNIRKNAMSARWVGLLLALLLGSRVGAQEAKVGFWNVENLFDVVDDSLSAGDDDWTPQGAQHWTYRHYQRKLQDIYKTIVAMDCPLLMGLAEVENDRVLRDLCQGTPLARLGYQFVHYDSPDHRGIDCALLYRKDRFRLMESSVIRFDFATRDILQVVGVASGGDTLVLWVCHLPSKLGGAEAEARRVRCLHRLKEAMDSAALRFPSATLLAMGDFNAEPHELPDLGYRNLMASLPDGEGSYCYQGYWSCIDQMLTNNAALSASVFRPDFLLEPDVRRLTSKPRRTYLGPRYHGGVSDHLPVFVVIHK